MSRWFRHYAGLCRDEKLVGVAIKSRQPVERVVWIWAAILESAAEIDDNGRYSLDAAEVAYFLRADEGDILAVEAALQTAGRVAGGAVVKWGNRQFTSDRSKERVAAHRERKRAERAGIDVSEPSQNGDVTLHGRHRNAPETETYTEEEKKEPLPEIKNSTTNVRSIGKPMRPVRDEIQERFWKAYPSRGDAANPKAPALDKFARAVKSGADPEEIIAAAGRYAEIERRAGRAGTEKVAQAVTWLNQRRWQDYAAAALPCASSPSLTFVARDSPEWLRRVASGHKPGLCKFYPEHQAEGWLFPAPTEKEAAA